MDVKLSKDFGVVTIPKIFIKEVLCDAPEAELKFMLRLLAGDTDARSERNTGLLNYWIDRGCISVDQDSGKTIIFTSSTIKAQNRNNNDNNGLKNVVARVEEILGRNLSIAELQVFMFAYKNLSFSTELTEHLADYCISKGKFSAPYIEKVAISWNENGVKTVEDAKKQSVKYPKEVYDYLKLLGRKDFLSPIETDTVNKWMRDYEFNDEIIKEAINKTISSGATRRLSYADSILERWHEIGVKNIKDIPEKPITIKKEKRNSFHNFKERKYDFDAIEKAVMNGTWNDPDKRESVHIYNNTGE